MYTLTVIFLKNSSFLVLCYTTEYLKHKVNLEKILNSLPSIFILIIIL